MQTIERPQINQSDFFEFLEWKKFKDQGGAIADLTYSPLIDKIPDSVHSYSNNLSGEGLSMKGAVRGVGKCKCGGKWENTGKVIICPKCKKEPKRYYVDLGRYEGKRPRLFQDKEGHTLDSYNRAFRLLEHIRYQIDNHSFDLKFWIKTDYQKFIFENYVWRWFDRSCENLAPSTKSKRKGFIKNYHIPRFGKKDIRSIRSGQIEDYYLSLPKGMSNKQKKNIIDDLHKLFSDAWRRENIEKIPVFPQIDFDTPLFQWIDRETQERVLENIPSFDRDIFRFIIMVGCRPGEALALMWDAIDLKNKIIYLKRTFSDTTLKQKTKTNDWRVIPITDEILEIMKRRGRSISGFVFVNQHGRHYTAKINVIWNKACEKAGIKINLYNGTRHSFGSQKINEGFTLDEIGAVMGHSDVKMTKRYARILTENLKAVIEGKKVVQLKSATSGGHQCVTKGAEDASK